MKFVENEVFHVYNRGNQQQNIFFRRENYLFFLQKIRYHLLPVCDLLAYCLMPNHFHLLILANDKTVATPLQSNPLIKNTAFSKELGKMLSSYTRALQKQEGFTGSLFQQKTKAKQVTNLAGSGENYVANCLAYIVNNPVKAGLVTTPEAWEFSNYRELVGLREGNLCRLAALQTIPGLQQESLRELLMDHKVLLETSEIF